MARKTKAPLSAAKQQLRIQRKRWYMRSIVPGLLLIAAIVYVSYTVLWNKHGVEAFENGDPRNAIWSFNHADYWMPAEQWLKPFNSGTAKAAQGAFNSAFTDFETAESLAPSLNQTTDYTQLDAQEMPPMCKIRVNHALTHLTVGGDLMKKADVLWDTVNAQQETAGRAPSKEKYKEHIEQADKHLVLALDEYKAAKKSYDQAVVLLSEYKCAPAEFTETAQAEADKAQRKIDAGNGLEDPPWRPRNDPAENDPDQDTKDPEQPQDGSENSEEPQEPEQPDDQGQNEEESEEQTQGSSNSDFSPDEVARQERLQERNKAGNIERQEADAYENATTPSKKQW